MRSMLLLSILASTGLARPGHPFGSVEAGETQATTRAATLNDRPIVGVFTQPSSSKQGSCGGDCLYLAASYVKNLEAAGARVVPINYYAGEKELDELFAGLNGIFFVGGGAAFPASAQYLFEKTVQANDAGDFAPLWGTCMGFQWLLISATRNPNILDPNDGTQMDAENYSIPLDFASNDILKSSRLYGSAPADVMSILATQNVTMNNHHYGIYTEHFRQTSALTSFYSLLSTNKDRKGVDFVSTIEAFKYPIFGVQWHPEKNPFEWAVTAEGVPYEAIDHSPDAIKVAQYMANFFVGQARKSTHRFQDVAREQALLIYNWVPTNTPGGDFVQTYFFPKDF
jgi:gamma-glutamyl hydrolase